MGKDAADPEDIWQYLETFLVVMTGKGENATAPSG